MNKLCFMKDDDGHYFSIPIELKVKFEEMMAEAYDSDNFDDFEIEFGHMQLDRHISCYSFENLEEIV